MRPLGREEAQCSLEVVGAVGDDENVRDLDAQLRRKAAEKPS